MRRGASETKSESLCVREGERERGREGERERKREREKGVFYYLCVGYHLYSSFGI